MSAVMRVPWVNRLTKLVQEPGGVRVGDAIEQAEQNLESIREECLRILDEHLARIEALSRAGGGAPGPEVVNDIYDVANDIHGVAGVFGLEQLGVAAFSLCELIDRLRHSGRWNPAAVEVHLAALRLFRHPSEESDAGSVLEGLRLVTERAPKAQEA